MQCAGAKVFVDQIHVRAFHGVMPQERTVGGDFTVSVEVTAPIMNAVKSDCVDDTVNYAVITDIVRQEMAVPSALLEHVAGRIAERLFLTFPSIEKIWVEVKKENPPMGADCKGAGVRACFVR